MINMYRKEIQKEQERLWLDYIADKTTFELTVIRLLLLILKVVVDGVEE